MFRQNQTEKEKVNTIGSGVSQNRLQIQEKKTYGPPKKKSEE